MEEELKIMKLQRSYRERECNNVRRDNDSTFGKYFKRIINMEDNTSIRKCKIRDILMLALDGNVEKQGDGYYFDEVSHDYVNVDGEKMLLLQNVGNLKELSYSRNCGHKVSYKENKNNVILYGKKKIYAFTSPFTYYEFDRDENTNIIAENVNSGLMFLGAPEEFQNMHFKKPLVIETYHDADLEIKLSENDKIMLQTIKSEDSGIEISAEDALSIMRTTEKDIDKLNENEAMVYNKLLNLSKTKSKHNISEVAQTVSDRRQENINKAVSEISDAMRETEKENIKTKED